MTSESRAWERPDGTLTGDRRADILVMPNGSVWVEKGPDRWYAAILSGGAARRQVPSDPDSSNCAPREYIETLFGKPVELASGELLDALRRSPLDAAALVAREDTASRDEDDDPVQALRDRASSCERIGNTSLASALRQATTDAERAVAQVVRRLGRAAGIEPGPDRPASVADVERAIQVAFWPTAPAQLGVLRGGEATPHPDTDPCPSCGVFWFAGQAGLDGTEMLVADEPCAQCRGGGADGGGEDERDLGPSRAERERVEPLIRANASTETQAVVATFFWRTDDEVTEEHGALGAADAFEDALDKHDMVVARRADLAINQQGRPAERRLATAAGVSPDSEDPVGAIEAAIRAGRQGHEELFAAEADYWHKRHGAVAGRVRAAVKALSGGGEHYLMEPGLESRPEPPVGTTFTNPETGAIAWQRQDDGWHCTRADCWNCPAAWDEVCDWGGGVDGLVRHLPVVRVGTGGGES